MTIPRVRGLRPGPRGYDLDRIESGSGLSRAQITRAAEIYMEAERVIACWAMGLTMGITVKPNPAFLQALGREFRFRPPHGSGYDTVGSIKAMAAGKVKALICLGGNLAAAAPDQSYTEAALSRLQLTVQVSTKLNRSHLIRGQDALILPCLGRTELDRRLRGRNR